MSTSLPHRLQGTAQEPDAESRRLGSDRHSGPGHLLHAAASRGRLGWTRLGLLLLGRGSGPRWRRLRRGARGRGRRFRACLRGRAGALRGLRRRLRPAGVSPGAAEPGSLARKVPEDAAFAALRLGRIGLGNHRGRRWCRCVFQRSRRTGAPVRRSRNSARRGGLKWTGMEIQRGALRAGINAWTRIPAANGEKPVASRDLADIMRPVVRVSLCWDGPRRRERTTPFDPHSCRKIGLRGHEPDSIQLGKTRRAPDIHIRR